MTALHKVAQNGHESTARLLLDRGTNINAKDTDRMTDLSWAARNGHKSTVRLFLDYGTDINAKERDNKMALPEQLKTNTSPRPSCSSITAPTSMPRIPNE